MKIEIDALSKEEGRVKANMGDAALKKHSKVLTKLEATQKFMQGIGIRLFQGLWKILCWENVWESIRLGINVDKVGLSKQKRLAGDW